MKNIVLTINNMILQRIIFKFGQVNLSVKTFLVKILFLLKPGYHDYSSYLFPAVSS